MCVLAHARGLGVCVAVWGWPSLCPVAHVAAFGLTTVSVVSCQDRAESPVPPAHPHLCTSMLACYPCEAAGRAVAAFQGRWPTYMEVWEMKATRDERLCTHFHTGAPEKP